MEVLSYSVVENRLVEVDVQHHALSVHIYVCICHLKSPLEATVQLLKMTADEGSNPEVIVTLTEADIPGDL